MKYILYSVIALMTIIASPVFAAEKTVCQGKDTTCLLELLEDTATTIEEERWRDSTLRELAKLLSHEKQTDQAIALIEKIKTPDTKAMTIRGIGMAAADENLTKDEYDALFARLTEEAHKIDHPPSYAIALTYIAMAQAFADDDDGAMKTAASMENDALRNKAYGESAEIQAERGNLVAATASINAIDDKAFQNRAFRLVSKIFANDGDYESALNAAQNIGNAYQKSQSILYILTRQVTPEEVSIE